jgi:glycerol-3-phosphate dehydrogenase (NAD(P)+)
MHPNIPDFEFHSNIIFKKEIQTCIEGSNCVVVAVPSHGMRDIIEKSSSFFTNEVIIVNVAKGIENGSLSTMGQVIKESSNLDSVQIVSLYGPSHAEEVIKGHPTTLVSASTDKSSAEYVQAIFSSDKLRVYTNNDIRGVELGGSLKNVIAIAAGICDGIGFGDNTKAALMTRGIAEITRLGVAMGANSDTFSGLSGIGDLIVTCQSIHSRNRYVGEEIGKGKSLASILDEIEVVAEGIKTTQSVFDLSKKYQVEMPICEGVYQILFNEKNPKEIVGKLMTRDLKFE